MSIISDNIRYVLKGSELIIFPDFILTDLMLRIYLH